MNYKDIVLDGSDGQQHSIGQFKQPIVLYFYAKDNIESSTIQAVNYSNLSSTFDSYGIKIVGVSKDSIESHLHFINENDLNLLLLSDPNGELLKAFDVVEEKRPFGKISYGIINSAFILDENGDIMEAYRKIKPDENIPRTLTKVKELFKPIKEAA